MSLVLPETKTVKQENGKLVTYFTENSYWRKSYENGKSHWGRRDIEYVKKFVSRPDIVVDVGANIGQETIYYADFAKTVISFEPGKFAFEVLKQNVEQNNLNNVILSNFGLSNDTTSAHLHMMKNEGMAYVTPNKSKKTEEIHLIKFDDFPLKEGKIDFIKIDVEGLELKVLQGMERTIKEHSPIFQIEMKDPWLERNGTSCMGVYEFLKDRGYEAFFSPNKKVPIDQIPHKNRAKADLFFKKS